MANYENSKDLKKEVLFHSGELDDGTSEYDEKVITFLNRAHQAMLSGGADLGLDVGQHWAWGKKAYPSSLIVMPSVRLYTMNVVNGSTTVTFTTAPVGSFLNYTLTFGDDRTQYRITSHVAGALTAAIDSIYIGSTALAVATRLMKYDYQLDPGILRLIGPFSASSSQSLNCNGKIELIDQVTFGREYPMAIREGIPDRITQIYKTNDMQPTVRFNRIPASQDQPVKVEYDYIPVPDDLTDDVNSIPLVPRDHRVTLCYYATYYLLMDKNDTRAAEYRELTRAGMMAMVRASKIEKANTNQNYGRLISRSAYGGYWGKRTDRGYY